MISVIMPLYNAEQTVKFAIESMLNQTFTNWELICMDDGSTDETAVIVKMFQEKDDRIQYFYQKNGGVSAARNAALGKISGQFVFFMDCDDTCDKDLLSHTIRRILDTKSDIVVFGYASLVDGKQLKEATPVGCENDTSLKKLIKNNLISVLYNKLYTAYILKNMRFYSTTIGEDYLFNLNLLQKKPRIATLNEKLYYYNLDTIGSLYKTYSKDRNYVLRKQFKILTNVLLGYDALDKEEILRLFKIRNMSGVIMNAYRETSPLNLKEVGNSITDEYRFYSIKFKEIFFCEGVSKQEKLKLLLAKMHLFKVLGELYQIKRRKKKV